MINENSLFIIINSIFKISYVTKILHYFRLFCDSGSQSKCMLFNKKKIGFSMYLSR